MTHPATLTVALGEYDIGWHDPATSLARAAQIVKSAAAQGATLVVLPEMCTSGFTMDTSFAEPIAGDNVASLGQMARAARVWLIAGVPTRSSDDDAAERTARNSALVFGPDGKLAAVYNKQRLFAYADEQRFYHTGDSPVVVNVDGMRVSPFICYDLRFPELFRRVAAETDLMVVIASWPASRRAHWDTLLRARAIENQCYVTGVNRIGDGGDLHYDGGSAAFDPWGNALELAAIAGTPAARTATVAAEEVERIRSSYPFLADCRM